MQRSQSASSNSQSQSKNTYLQMLLGCLSASASLNIKLFVHKQKPSLISQTFTQV